MYYFNHMCFRFEFRSFWGATCAVLPYQFLHCQLLTVVREIYNRWRPLNQP